MSNINSTHYHGNSSAASSCEHCHGTNEHETWCVTRDPKVQYAFAIVNDAFRLTYSDSLILHSLGVAWTT